MGPWKIQDCCPEAIGLHRRCWVRVIDRGQQAVPQCITASGLMLVLSRPLKTCQPILTVTQASTRPRVNACHSTSTGSAIAATAAGAEQTEAAETPCGQVALWLASALLLYPHTYERPHTSCELSCTLWCLLATCLYGHLSDSSHGLIMFIISVPGLEACNLPDSILYKVVT